MTKISAPKAAVISILEPIVATLVGLFFYSEIPSLIGYLGIVTVVFGLIYLEKGANRVILGTVAIKNFEFTKAMAEKYGEKIAVGVDAKNGKVAVNGWLEDSGIDSVEFCKKLAAAGVKTIIYTDISKDGMLSGCNLDIYKELCKIEGIDIVASGGVTSVSEVKTLKEYGCAGVIIGKAIYEGKITLEEALEAAKD